MTGLDYPPSCLELGIARQFISLFATRSHMGNKTCAIYSFLRLYSCVSGVCTQVFNDVIVCSLGNARFKYSFQL